MLSSASNYYKCGNPILRLTSLIGNVILDDGQCDILPVVEIILERFKLLSTRTFFYMHIYLVIYFLVLAVTL